jgi:hypothetical protein
VVHVFLGNALEGVRGARTIPELSGQLSGPQIRTGSLQERQCALQQAGPLVALGRLLVQVGVGVRFPRALPRFAALEELRRADRLSSLQERVRRLLPPLEHLEQLGRAEDLAPFREVLDRTVELSPGQAVLRPTEARLLPHSGTIEGEGGLREIAAQERLDGLGAPFDAPVAIAREVDVDRLGTALAQAEPRGQDAVVATDPELDLPERDLDIDRAVDVGRADRLTGPGPRDPCLVHGGPTFRHTDADVTEAGAEIELDLSNLARAEPDALLLAELPDDLSMERASDEPRHRHIPRATPHRSEREAASSGQDVDAPAQPDA